MQTFKERLAAMVGHLGEHVALFAREEFSRAVAHAILPIEDARSPGLAVLAVVNDRLSADDDSPLSASLRDFIYRTLREVMSEECDDSPLSNHMRDFVARTLSDILDGNIDEGEEPGMAKAHREVFDVIEGYSQACLDHERTRSRIRSMVREEIAAALRTVEGT